MKKILLGLLGAGLWAQVSAQQAKEVGAPLFDKKEGVRTNLVKPTNQGRATRAGSRWYDPLDASLVYFNGDTSGLDANTNSTFLWKDSTMRVRYSGAGGTSYLGGIYLKSAAQILDPFANRFNDYSKVPQYGGEMALKLTDAYTLDSIGVAGFYRRIATKASVVDSLILTVGYGNLTGGVSTIGASYGITAANGGITVSCYLTDTMRIGALDYSFANLGLAGNNVVRRAIPLRVADSGGQYFYAPVGLNVPAGNLVAMSVDFKSGDTWVPNVDSVADFNFFRLYYTEEVANTVQNFRKGDFNSTHSLETDTSGWGNSYVPNYLYIVGANNTCTGGFDREQYWTLWKLSSATANNFVSVAELSAPKASIGLAPNPVTDNLEITLDVKKSTGTASFEIYTAQGQLVRNFTVNNLVAGAITKHNVDMANLAPGMYVATVTIDGVRVSNRFAKQ
jgi:hypothetical protein